MISIIYIRLFYHGVGEPMDCSLHCIWGTESEYPADSSYWAKPRLWWQSDGTGQKPVDFAEAKQRTYRHDMKVLLDIPGEGPCPVKHPIWEPLPAYQKAYTAGLRSILDYFLASRMKCVLIRYRKFLVWYAGFCRELATTSDLPGPRQRHADRQPSVRARRERGIETSTSSAQ